ncbi:MAG TPA: FtsX-like permease family protein [Bryobacteraceae bacterium]
MLRHLPLILKNCWRNRRRTILTILSISVSLCLLGVMMAIYHAFYFKAPDSYQALRLIVRNRVSLAFGMPQSYREKILQVPGVAEAGISQWFGGMYIDRRPEHMFARFAVEPAKVFRLRGELTMPEDQKKAFLTERTACIVGRTLAKEQNFKIGQKITLVGDIFPYNMEFTIRGIFDAPVNDELLYFNRDYLEETLPLGRRGQAGTINVLAATTADVPRIEAAIDDMFHNSPTQTKTETESAFSLSFVAMLGNVKAFLLSIVGAVTFTILLVSANTIAMSVRERVREVGILKTLGFTPGTILGIILGEAVAIALIGGVIGVALAAAMTTAVGHMPGMLIPELQQLALVPEVAASCLGVAAAIGLLSALIPAINASRISILQALRSTD